MQQLRRGAISKIEERAVSGAASRPAPGAFLAHWNARVVTTARGGVWTAVQVGSILRRV